jgi:Protein of unknown function (DUF1566)
MSSNALARFAAVCLFLTLASVVLADRVAASPEASLQRCQRTVQKSSAKFVAKKSKAFGVCLTKVSDEIVGKGAPDAAGAASTCASVLAKVGAIEQKMQESIAAACDPANGVDHTFADVRGIGAGVSEPLDARNLDVYCASFGGDGVLDSVAEWIDCIDAADECAVDAALAAQFPRVLEWLDRVRPPMAALVPTPTAALAALDATNAAIEGPVDDDIVHIGCGGHDLPASGQLTAYPSETNDGIVGPVAVPDDGTLRFGAPLRYADNGDGTISDLVTGLMWEKKSDDGGLHDQDDIYVWSSENGLQETIWDWLADVNAEGGTGFAGHSDWRIPNVRELASIVDYEQADPAVDPIFATGCAPGCTTATCSCTSSFHYWTSTTQAETPLFAWVVVFGTGSVDPDQKISFRYVRAVRGRS